MVGKGQAKVGATLEPEVPIGPVEIFGGLVPKAALAPIPFAPHSYESAVKCLSRFFLFYRLDG